MRISFDMDGVLADMDGALARLAAQEFGKPVTGGPASAVEAQAAPDVHAAPDALVTPSASSFAPGTPEALPSAVVNQLSPRQQVRLWSRVRATRNFWETLKECEPGMVRRLQTLAHRKHWDILFVTQRPETAGRTPQLQTQHWLRRHGFEYPAVYTTQGSRGKIAAALTLDVHIDDRIDNAVDIASDSKAWPILVWRDEESFDRVGAGAAKLKIAMVRTVSAALDKIEEAERGLAGQDGGTTLLARLTRVFAVR